MSSFMEKQCFAHLHVHTEQSLIDGLGHVSRTVGHAKSLGFSALGMTDHGTLANTLAFNNSCRDNGVKPITGLEGYVIVEGKRFHITLLADGNKGFKSLVELNNLGVLNSKDHSRPAFNIEDFKTYNEGIYLLTGCPESPLQSQDISWGDVKNNFRYLKKHFGNRMFVEMMLVNYGTPYERAIELSKEFNTPLIVTNDVHFAKKEDADIHLRLLKMNSGGFSYNSEHLYLATEDQLRDRLVNEFGRKDLLPYLDKGMSNAFLLANTLTPVIFDSKPKLPHIPDSNKVLQKLIDSGYERRIASGDIVDSIEYRNRIHREFGVVSGMDFSTYFIVLQDVVEYAHKHNIWVDPARGSGGGSLLLYLIGVTEVDPIKYDLLFGRFLNENRSDMPDVDVNFESEKKQKVIDYAAERWNSTQVVTYSRYSHKSLLTDLKKSFNIPDALAKRASELGKDSEEFLQIAESNVDFLDMYDAMDGQVRHKSKHPGGVVINEGDFSLPLTKTKNGDIVSAWTEGMYSHELGDVGLIKFDFLASAYASVLHRLHDMTGVLPEPCTNDHEVFSLFQNANTNGVFQFGSDGIKGLLSDVQPNSFEDLCAINALFRPGPLDSGAAAMYPELKRQNKQRSLHPDIDHFLEETYGIIVYQEQFMRIVGWLCGTGIDDTARKILTKKDEEKLPILREQVFSGGKDRGWTESEIQLVWYEIKTHAGYSFNKSHTVAYTLISWRTAWYKFYYPVEFYCASLNVESGNPDKVEEYMIDAVMSGIEIQYPDINNSTKEYNVVDSKIYLPLTAIKYISDKSFDKIVPHRPFVSVREYMELPKSYIKKRGREGLLALGGFDSIPTGYDEGVELHEILDTDNTMSMTDAIKQKKYLGYILPTKKFIETRIQAEQRGLIMGFVESVEVRNKGKGDYKVVRLLPSGSFWFKSKDFKRFKIKEGDVIAVKKNDWGQCTNVYEVGL